MTRSARRRTPAGSGIRHESRDEADAGRQRGGGRQLHPWHADDPQLAGRLRAEAPPRVEQDVDPLVGAQQAGERDDRRARRRLGQLGRKARVERGEVGEGAVRDDGERAVEAQLAGQPGTAVLGVHDDVVDALVEAALARLARARLARQDVVGGQDGRTRPRQERTSSGWTVSHWKWTTSAAAAARR